MPREGHDGRLFACLNTALDISIHVPREGHDADGRSVDSVWMISIHVPREGHDASVSAELFSPSAISIHVPREGHDQC